MKVKRPSSPTIAFKAMRGVLVFVTPQLLRPGNESNSVVLVAVPRHGGNISVPAARLKTISLKSPDCKPVPRRVRAVMVDTPSAVSVIGA